MKKTFALFLLILSIKVHAQDLVISDVDDTIKLAHVPSLRGSLEYVIDRNSHFTGMNSLYQLVHADNPLALFFYVSKAPEWLMKSTHKSFLKRVGFPEGTYVGRSSYSADEHKLRTIRNLINRYNPQRVLLVGDNGEQDAIIYARIINEYANQGIQFSQYIHIVYKKMIILTYDQIGFVTAIELSADLVQNSWLTAASDAQMKNNVLPRILTERPGADNGAVAFPNFMNCKDIDWRWDIPGLNEKIKSVCH